MPVRAFVIPRRYDARGMNIQILDLVPNTSQRNSIYDGQGQTFYITAPDVFGSTVETGNTWVSGSRMTDTTTGLYDGYANDTTGGGNDVLATSKACFGLAAYLKERVQPGGVGNANAGRMTIAHAITQAKAIAALVETGGNLDLTAVNTVLCNAGVGGTAQTDLNGATGASKSFGAITDILRILSGEIYVSPVYTIICNVANQFRSLAQRNTLVTNQDVVANGGKTFVAEGHFLATTENGYVNIPVLAFTGEFYASTAEGQIYKWSKAIPFLNPDFSYAAGSSLPRATKLDLTNIPASGSSNVLRAYLEDGTLMV